LEGFSAIVNKVLLRNSKPVKPLTMNRAAGLFILLSAWGAATWNPSILGIIETLSGPVIALILFLMPMYAIHRVPAMQKYSGHISNLFVVAVGLVTISAVFFSMLR
jgi:serine transporter